MPFQVFVLAASAEAVGVRSVPENPGENGEEGQLLRAQKRNWQLWSAAVLGVGVVGLALALYELLRAPSGAWSPQGLAQFVPPLMFGVVALFLLLNFYVAQKEAIIQGLHQELIKHKIEAELNREFALLDPVTEVYNRRYLRVILLKEINRVKRYGKELSVMLVDITGFRRVNESLGHTGGDVVLKQIAHLIQTRIRNSDYIVRFGGDEFLVVLPETEDAGVQQLAGRLKDAMEEWSRHSGMTEFGLRLAIGVARYFPGRPVDEILKLAEQRMVQDRRAPETPEKETRPTTAATEKTTS